MKTTFILNTVVLSLGLALAGCGGGGGGSNNNTNTTTSTTPIVPTDAQIRQDIAISQGSNAGIPIWDTSATYDPNTLTNPYKGPSTGVYSYRWNIERDGLIPVIDTTGRAETTTALNNLEAAVGKTLFTRLPATTDQTTFNRGIIINNVVPPTFSGANQENNCGAVYANRSNFFSLWIDSTYSIDPPLNASWQTAVNASAIIDPRPTFNVDIDFNNASCGTMEPLVEHELVHSLGLVEHFDGFGEGSGGNCNGAICTDRTYPVLKTLYANPPMTEIDQMTIAR